MCVLEIRCCVELLYSACHGLGRQFPFSELSFPTPLPHALLPSFFLLFLSIHGFFMCIYCPSFSLIPSLPVVPCVGLFPPCGSPPDFLPCIFYHSLFPISPKVFYSHLMIYFLVLWHINKHIILNIGSAYLRKHTVSFFFFLKRTALFHRT